MVKFEEQKHLNYQSVYQQGYTDGHASHKMLEVVQTCKHIPDVYTLFITLTQRNCYI